MNHLYERHTPTVQSATCVYPGVYIKEIFDSIHYSFKLCCVMPEIVHNENIVTTTGRVRMVCGRNQLRGGWGAFLILLR